MSRAESAGKPTRTAVLPGHCVCSSRDGNGRQDPRRSWTQVWSAGHGQNGCPQKRGRESASRRTPRLGCRCCQQCCGPKPSLEATMENLHGTSRAADRRRRQLASQSLARLGSEGAWPEKQARRICAPLRKRHLRYGGLHRYLHGLLLGRAARSLRPLAGERIPSGMSWTTLTNGAMPKLHP